MLEARDLRGLLVLALYAQFPGFFTDQALQNQVRVFYRGDQEALVRDIAYLQRSGYLTVTEQKLGPRRIRAYELTPQGVDIAEGSTTDPGVDIGGDS